jgi:uncharacterized membrane protein YciS (DUF1049 family)
MARRESSIESLLAVALFCGLSLLSVVGWGYMFMTEEYPNLSRTGEMIAIGFGLGVAPMWLLGGTYLLVKLLDRQTRPHPVWILVCVFFGAMGGLANLMGWAAYLGPAV